MGQGSRNIKLTIQYDGTRYAGWQFQKNAKAIQNVIEHALGKITCRKVALIGSGRTDAGVHANGQIANFKTSSRLPLENLHMALNSRLPKDIVVSQVEEAGPRFNAQHDAKSKVYRYTIANANFVDPFIRHFAARCFFRLDTSLMRKGAGYLIGRRDFRSFMTNSGVNEADTVRTIKKIEIEKDGDLIYIDIEADGFLYNMVRNIVGTLIDVGRGRIPPRRIKEILAAKDRKLSGPAAPAKGLSLVKVRY